MVEERRVGFKDGVKQRRAVTAALAGVQAQVEY